MTALEKIGNHENYLVQKNELCKYIVLAEKVILKRASGDKNLKLTSFWCAFCAGQHLSENEGFHKITVR